LSLDCAIRHSIDPIFFEICATCLLSEELDNNIYQNNQFLNELDDYESFCRLKKPLASSFLKNTNIQFIQSDNTIIIKNSLTAQSNLLKPVMILTNNVNLLTPVLIKASIHRSANIKLSRYKNSSLFPILKIQRGGATTDNPILWESSRFPLLKIRGHFLFKLIIFTILSVSTWTLSNFLVSQTGVLNPDQLALLFREIKCGNFSTALGIFQNKELFEQLVANLAKQDIKITRFNYFAFFLQGNFSSYGIDAINSCIAFGAALITTFGVSIFFSLNVAYIIGLLQGLIFLDLLFSATTNDYKLIGLFLSIIINAVNRIDRLLSLIVYQYKEFTDLPKNNPQLFEAWQHYCNQILNHGSNPQDEFNILQRRLNKIREMKPVPASNVLPSEPPVRYLPGDSNPTNLPKQIK
jgi:hypothetical protein